MGDFNAELLVGDFNAELLVGDFSAELLVGDFNACSMAGQKWLTAGICLLPIKKLHIKSTIRSNIIKSISYIKAEQSLYIIKLYVPEQDYYRSKGHETSQDCRRFIIITKWDKIISPPIRLFLFIVYTRRPIWV